MTLSLTNAGINALLRAMCGDDLTFTNVRIGNGNAQSAATATALANQLLELTITDMTRSGSSLTLSVSFNNADVDAGFRLREVGIFVEDQDDDTKEVLYAYGSEPEETADYIASSGDSILETAMEFTIFVSAAQNVSAVINASLQYATKAEFTAHAENKGNPHEVTKAQVELGNVPNVSTNDQTPTYTPPTNITEMSSGEKISVAFGKIARAISAIITHLSNTNNPHNVKAVQVGAAPTSHSHKASDMISGTLPVARGGTGRSSFDAYKVLYSSFNSIEMLATPSKPGMVLQQGLSGAPFWGFASGSESKSYYGTNYSGADHQNSLTFELAPKIVIIMQSGQYRRWGMLFPAAGRGFSEYDGVTSDLVVSVSDKTVSWYAASAGAANQFNSLHTYYVVGIY